MDCWWVIHQRCPMCYAVTMSAETDLSRVTVLDTAGRTPLHYAAMHGRMDAVSVLVQHGASVHAADTRGHFQPLHLAADAGQCDAVARLVALGADIEARTVKGFSPLVLAVMKVRRWAAHAVWSHVSGDRIWVQ